MKEGRFVLLIALIISAVWQINLLIVFSYGGILYALIDLIIWAARVHIIRQHRIHKQKKCSSSSDQPDEQVHKH